MIKSRLIIPIIMLLFLCSCGNRVYRSDLIIPSPETVIENISVKTFKTENLNSMDITLKNAQVSFTNWGKKEVKVQIETIDQNMNKGTNTDKIKAEDAVLLDFKDNNLTIKEPAKQKQNVLNKISIYCPSEVKNINANIENGGFTAGGDLISTLKFRINKGNIDLARFKGTIDAEVSSGNITVGSGKLNGKSKIYCKSGNIDVKTEIAKTDSYSFQADSGNIKLGFPAKTTGDFTCQGNVLSNAFSSSSYGSKILVSNREGVIQIKKY